MTLSKRTHVVIGVLPILAHFTPLNIIAQHLVLRGYDVCVICTQPFRQRIEDVGAKFISLVGWETFDDSKVLQWIVEKRKLDSRFAVGSDAIQALWTHLIPSSHDAILHVLSQKPDTPIVILHDPLFYGALPIQLHAPVLKPAGVISIGIMPLSMHSIDTSPPFSGSVLDNSAKGRMNNEKLNLQNLQRLAPQKKYLNETLTQLRANESPFGGLDAIYRLADIHVQLCPPSLEYPRIDQPTDLRFTGGLPRVEAATVPSPDLPSWWGEVTSIVEGKRVVSVSQGTISFDYNLLVVPTMQALADRDDFLVLVALGKKGATLPENIVIPANVRVSDWISFDDLLSYSDVFVTNGGYGSFQNAIARGVPLVVSPIALADKPDIAARVAWSGVGINLGLDNCTKETVGAAIEEIFRDPKYTGRVAEVKSEIESYDPIGVISQAIDDLGDRFI